MLKRCLLKNVKAESVQQLRMMLNMAKCFRLRLNAWGQNCDILVNTKFSASFYLLTVSNSGLLFDCGAVTGSSNIQLFSVYP